MAQEPLLNDTSVQEEAPPQQQEDKQAEAIKFIKEKLQSSFDEQK